MTININKKYLWLYCLIFSLALFVRLFKLSSIPYGFHVDEAKAGWNAYSILKTGADDKGNRLPMYYDSFGDFRPSGLIYLIIPSLIIFGQNVFAVRFPFALIGALTFIPLILVVRELSEKNNHLINLAIALLLSLNPWHIIASRSTSESIVALFLTLWGFYFLLRSIKFPVLKNILLSILFLVSSYFFYHNIRVLAPIFVLVIIGFYYFNKNIKVNKKVFLIFMALILSSLIFFSSKSARGRMSQVSILSDFGAHYEIVKMPSEEGPGQVFIARAFHNKVAAYSRRILEEYSGYFSTGFLVGNLAKPIRYTVPQVGLLTYFEFALIIFGLFLVSKKNELLLIILLLAVAPLPAAVTNEDTPNLQRAMFMVPFLITLAAYGFSYLYKNLNKAKGLLILFILGYLGNFVYFYHMYLVHQRMGIASYYRDGGNVELVKKISELSSNYRQIILPNSPDDLYPWFALLNNYDPKIFNKSYQEIEGGVRKYNNLVFSADKCPLNSALNKDNKNIDNVLFVDAEGCVVDSKYKSLFEINLIETIFRPDGSPPYYLKSAKQLK